MKNTLYSCVYTHYFLIAHIYFAFYDKRKLQVCVTFLSLFFLLASKLSAQTILINEDFAKNTIDLNTWTVAVPEDVFAKDGILQMSQNVTDKTTGISTKSLPLNNNSAITLERRVKVHRGTSLRAGEYFFPSITIKFEDTNSFLNLYYWHCNYNYGQYTDLKSGIYLSGTDNYMSEQKGDPTKDIKLAENIFDEWFNEKLTFESATGKFSYYLNNKLVKTGQTDKPKITTQKFSLWFSPYGWWTGHYHYMDDVKVSVSNESVATSLSDGLVAYYPFNGNYDDASGNGNNGQKTGTTLETDRTGNTNSNACRFNGTSDFIKIPNAASLNPQYITVAAWVKPAAYYEGSCAGNMILTKGGETFVPNNAGVYNLEFTGTNGCNTNFPKLMSYFNIRTNNSNNTLAGANSGGMDMKLNEWQFLVGTYDGSQVKYYRNGVLMNTTNAVGKLISIQDDVFIGVNSPYWVGQGYPYWFNGWMDDIHIYNRAITTEEVKQLYGNSNNTCPTTDISILNLKPAINQASGYQVLQGATIHHYFWVKDAAQQPVTGAVITYSIEQQSTSRTFRSKPSDATGLIDLAINLDGNDKESQADDLISANTSAVVKFVGIENICNKQVTTNEFKSFGIVVSPFEGKYPKHGFSIKGGPIYYTPSVDIFYKDLENGEAGYGLKVAQELTLDILKGKVNDNKNVALNSISFDKGLKAGFSTYLFLDNAHYESVKDGLFVLYLLFGGSQVENFGIIPPVNHYIHLALKQLLGVNKYKLYDANFSYGLSHAASLDVNVGANILTKIPFVEKVFRNNNIAKFNLLNLKGNVTVEKYLYHDGSNSVDDNALNIKGSAVGAMGISLNKISTSPETGKESATGVTNLLSASGKATGFLGLLYSADPSLPIVKGKISYGYSTNNSKGILIAQSESDLTVTNSFEVGKQVLDFLNKNNALKSSAKNTLSGVGADIVFPNTDGSIQNTVIEEINSINKLVLDGYNPAWGIGQLSYKSNRTYKTSDNLDFSLPFTKGKAGVLKLNTYAEADFIVEEKKAHPETKSLLTTTEYPATNKFVKVKSPIQATLSALKDAFAKAVPKLIEIACEQVSGFCKVITGVVGGVKDGILTLANTARKYSPFLQDGEKLQVQTRGTPDYSILIFSIPEGGTSFPINTNIELEYYYPGGEVKAVTTNRDTLVIISDIFFLTASLKNDTLKTAANGNFNIKAYLGADDLTFYGFDDKSEVVLLHQYNGDATWQVVGKLSRTSNNISFPFNKTGTFALARLLPNKDKTAPKITVQSDKLARVGDLIYATITDSSGINWNAVKITLEGKVIPFKRVGNTNQIQIPTDSLSTTPLRNIFLSIQAQDLRGNSGYEVVILNNDITTATQEIVIYKHLLHVFPNPSADKVTAIWQWHGENKISFEIYDVAGKQVQREHINYSGEQLQRIELSVRHLPIGIYIMAIKENGRILDTRKFIKIE